MKILEIIELLGIIGLSIIFTMFITNIIVIIVASNVFKRFSNNEATSFLNLIFSSTITSAERLRMRFITKRLYHINISLQNGINVNVTIIPIFFNLIYIVSEDDFIKKSTFLLYGSQRYKLFNAFFKKSIYKIAESQNLVEEILNNK